MYTLLNALLLGGLDDIKALVLPEDPFSYQHIMDGILIIMKWISIYKIANAFLPGPGGRLKPQGKPSVASSTDDILAKPPVAGAADDVLDKPPGVAGSVADDALPKNPVVGNVADDVFDDVLVENLKITSNLGNEINISHHSNTVLQIKTQG